MADPTDALEPVRSAIERGDLVEARRIADALQADPDPQIRARARDASAQLGIDPVTVAVMLATGLVFVCITALYLHRHDVHTTRDAPVTVGAPNALPQ